MQLLSASDVGHQLAARHTWKIERGSLVRSFEFPNFSSALLFVNRVGEQAERIGHHPDIEIKYNKVRLSVVSHDAGGLTDLDFELTATIDTLL